MDDDGSPAGGSFALDSDSKTKRTKRRKERHRKKERPVVLEEDNDASSRSRSRSYSRNKNAATVVPIKEPKLPRSAFEKATATKASANEVENDGSLAAGEVKKLQFADAAGKYLETVHHIENCHYGVHDEKGSYESRRFCEGLCSLM